MLALYLPRMVVFCVCLTFFTSTPLFSQTTDSHSLETDSLALVDIYNALNGPNWVDFGQGWLIDNVGNWEGVEVENGRISKLSFVNNGTATDLVGHVPSSIGDLDSLQTLHFRRNGIQSLPQDISKLNSLQEFRMHSTAYVGTIPDIFDGLESLKIFSWFGNENMSGPLPQSLLELSNLEFLQLSSIPTESFPTDLSRLRALRSLRLGGVLLESSINQFASSLLTIDSLQSLHVSAAKIEAPLPLEIFQVNTLRRLSVEYGLWTGSIPEEISQLQNLERLFLHETSLSGVLPESLGDLSNLQQLWLLEDNFDGDLPISLENLNELSLVAIQNTELSGSLDPIMDSSDKILAISIFGNQFSGEIPISIQYLRDLDHLDLHGNQLEGPVRINFTALDSLDLGANCDLGGNAASLCIEDTPENRAVNSSGFCNISFCSTSVSYSTERPISKIATVDIYPNPAKTHLNISTTANKLGGIQIFDLLGRLKMERSGGDLSRLDISELSAGQYFVHFSDVDDGVITKPLTITN